MNYILKKIFLPKVEKEKKYLLLNAVSIEIKEKKYLMVQYCVEMSAVGSSQVGYVILDGYTCFDNLDTISKLVEKKVFIEVENGRSSPFMNKRLIKSIKYRRKKYVFDNI